MGLSGAGSTRFVASVAFGMCEGLFLQEFDG